MTKCKTCTHLREEPDGSRCDLLSTRVYSPGDHDLGTALHGCAYVSAPREKPEKLTKVETPTED